jgi:hypothetical protein
MNKEQFAGNYKHIPGWGVDANPQDHPNYPMKHYTGDDHERINWDRPQLQHQDVEVLHSNERPGLSAVFGTSVPPSGLSGMIRRLAFKFSEGSWGHWLPLILADRVNVAEGLVEDLAKQYLPASILDSTKGLKEEWEKHPEKVMKKAAIGLSIAGALVIFLAFSKSRRKHPVSELEVLPPRKGPGSVRRERQRPKKHRVPAK